MTNPPDDFIGAPPGANINAGSAEGNVLAWRMYRVEEGLARIDQKMDAMGRLYVPSSVLELMLSPLREKILALESEQQAKELEDSNRRAQLKLALFVASVSPLFSALAAYLIGSK